MSNVVGIFFDFDGVILESADIKTAAFLELFSNYTEHQEAIRQYHIRHMGISRFVKFKWIYKELLKQELDDVVCAELGNNFSRIVFRKVMDAPFVPGALELLRYCKGRILSFVASGTPEAELKEIVEKRKIREFFMEVNGTPETKEEIVRKLLAQYRLVPTHCLFVGDALSDYEAAQATGVNFIARLTPSLKQTWNDKNVVGVDNLKQVITFLNGN